MLIVIKFYYGIIILDVFIITVQLAEETFFVDNIFVESGSLKSGGAGINEVFLVI